MKHLLLALGFGLSLCACEAPAPAPASAPTTAALAPDEDASELVFFDESEMLAGAVELTEAACVGTGTIEIRGQLATLSPQAVSLADEHVVSGIRVALGKTSQNWDLEEEWMNVTTDALGRFCFRLPAEQELGAGVLLQSATTPALRRVVLDARDVNIHLSSEAIVRLVQKTGAKPSTHQRVGLLNLTTMVGTRLELLEPVAFAPDTSAEAVLDMILERLEGDERIRAGLEAMQSGQEH